MQVLPPRHQGTKIQKNAVCPHPPTPSPILGEGEPRCTVRMLRTTTIPRIFVWWRVSNFVCLCGVCTTLLDERCLPSPPNLLSHFGRGGAALAAGVRVCPSILGGFVLWCGYNRSVSRHNCFVSHHNRFASRNNRFASHCHSFVAHNKALVAYHKHCATPVNRYVSESYCM